ncbi:MAG: hypothetical protein ABIR28_01785 [Vicinamibacteria bacterium]
MKKTVMYSPILALGLMGFAGSAAQAQPDLPRPSDQQYDRREGRRSQRAELMALQDDLALVDDGLAALPQRHRRYSEFQRRAEGIRAEVTNLANDVNRRAPDRPSSGQVEIASLRLKIATLRDDIEDAQQRRARAASYQLPAGTEVEVALNTDVSSRVSNPGDRLEAQTISAVRLNGRTIIPAGATVRGSVREVRSRNRGQQDGFLQMDFDTLIPEGGASMPIRAHVVSISENHEQGHDHQLRNGGLGALIGGVLGGIIDGKKGALIGAAVGAGGGVLASKGDDVELPEGTIVTIRLDGPVMARR